MLEYFKNTFFGFNRANSQEVKSKFKPPPQKRPLSFDSKQKEEKEKLKTSKKHERPEVIEFDETLTIKRQTKENERMKEKGDYSKVSDIDDDTYQGDMADSKAMSVNPEKDKNRPTLALAISPSKEPEFPKSSIIPQNKKILIKRESPRKAIRAILEKCAICARALHVNESLQLACTHRFHKECAVQMQWRMRYRCDICEVKLDHNRGSILLSHSRCRKHYG